MNSKQYPLLHYNIKNTTWFIKANVFWHNLFIFLIWSQNIGERNEKVLIFIKKVWDCSQFPCYGYWWCWYNWILNLTIVLNFWYLSGSNSTALSLIQKQTGGAAFWGGGWEMRQWPQKLYWWALEEEEAVDELSVHRWGRISGGDRVAMEQEGEGGGERTMEEVQKKLEEPLPKKRLHWN